MISKWKKLVGLLNSSNTQINPATEDKQDSLLTELQLKADLTETQPVSVASLPLPTGAATEAKQDTAITQLTNAVNNLSNIYTRQADGNQITQVYNAGSAVSPTNPLAVDIPAVISTNNATSTPLGNGGVFDGTFDLTNGFGIIYVSVFADQDSATDGFALIQSIDGITDHFCDCYSITAASPYGQTFSVNPHARYFRVKYTNGVTPQTSFAIQVIYKNIGKSSSHKIQNAIVNEDDSELVKAVITGENPAGTFINFSATTAGNFKCSLEELENAVSVNSNTQLKTTSFDSSGNEGQSIIGFDYVSGKSGIDAYTETLQTIDYAHHEIHSGSNFRVQHNADAIPATGSSGCLVIAFFVPDQAKEPHMIWETSHEGNMTATLFEGVTFNASAGTDRAPKNSNRNSATTSILQGKATGSLVSNYVTVGENSSDAIYTGGTAISILRDYSAKSVSGSQARRQEVILKTNTNYAFCLSNNETSTQGGQIRLEWYEHEPKN